MKIIITAFKKIKIKALPGQFYLNLRSICHNLKVHFFQKSPIFCLSAHFFAILSVTLFKRKLAFWHDWHFPQLLFFFGPTKKNKSENINETEQQDKNFFTAN
jgi:hypothetical protein